MHVQLREAVADGAQGRHEGRGDGHTAQHGAAFLAAGFHNSSEATEEGYKNVVDGGVGAGEQLGGVF